MAARGSHTADDIEAIYASQKGRCYWCQERVGKDYHVDHRIPMSRGGTNNPDNIVIACPHCNQSKKDKLPHEWAGQLF
jgi:5-methylcytosine-specific restriction endonuclease McrA